NADLVRRFLSLGMSLPLVAIRLPDFLIQDMAPTALTAPYPVAWNAPLARQLRLSGDLSVPTVLAQLAGNALPPGSRPVAAGYAGHQFGSWVPQLGDGRAIQI